jgi:hypothetical protein
MSMNPRMQAHTRNIDRAARGYAIRTAAGKRTCLFLAPGRIGLSDALDEREETVEESR